MFQTRRNKIRLTREKQIVADDRGAEEFTVLDETELEKEKYLLIVEAKGSLGAAMDNVWYR